MTLAQGRKYTFSFSLFHFTCLFGTQWLNKNACSVYRALSDDFLVAPTFLKTLQRLQVEPKGFTCSQFKFESNTWGMLALCTNSGWWLIILSTNTNISECVCS